MRIEGFIRTWNDERGFGFIQPAQGGDDIFVHIKAFSTRTARPQINERVWFDIEQGPGGKMRACNVEAVRAHRPAARRQHGARPQPRTTSLIAIPVFLCIYVAASVKWHPPIEIGLVYLELEGPDPEIDKAVQYLTSRGVRIEAVAGGVPKTGLPSRPSA